MHRDLREKTKRYHDYDEIPHYELEKTIVAEKAILELPQALEELGLKAGDEVVLVMDETPMDCDGASVKPMVRDMLDQAGFAVTVVELEGDEYGLVHADFHEAGIIKDHLKANVGVVGLGSGVISDLTKHACFLFEDEQGLDFSLPLVVVQTAASVPSPASQVSILTKDGVKRSWPSRLPQVVIQDLGILRCAPLEYNVGGIGDMSVLFNALADWYLGDYFGMSKFKDASFYILEDARNLLFPYTGEVNQGSSVGMEVLGKIVTLGGLTMTFAGESSPVSGYEHVVSHMLDMSAQYYQRSLASHGQQCGLATFPSLIGLGFLLEELDPKKVNIDKCYPTEDEMEKKVKDTFAHLDSSGAIGQECWNDYKKKLETWHAMRPRFETFLANWEQEKAVIRSMIESAESFAAAMQAAGHPLLFEELNVPISEDQGRWAFHNAHLMRKRFSAGDLVYYLGWFDEKWTDRVFARMREIVKQVRE